MASSIKIRTKLQDGIVTVRALITHPMEFGIREDEKTGEVRPGRFITDVFCSHNGQQVLKANWAAGISKNPYLSFQFTGAKADDVLSIEWRDNQGQGDKLDVAIS
jgi:sulfur-oxidizing protein SoxZ